MIMLQYVQISIFNSLAMFGRISDLLSLCLRIFLSVGIADMKNCTMFDGLHYSASGLKQFFTSALIDKVICRSWCMMTNVLKIVDERRLVETRERDKVHS